MENDKHKILLDKFPSVNRDALIPILQSFQDEFGYLSDEAIETIGSYLNLPASKVYGLATFYNQFTFKPRGKFHIRVCNGSACHIDHTASILKEIYKHLGIIDGKTTRDGLFSLEIMACMGACSQSPVIAINDVYYPRVKSNQIKSILENTKSQISL